MAYWLPLACLIALTAGLTVAALTSMRAKQKRSEQQLAAERDQLEQHVQARTTELAAANAALERNRELLSLALRASGAGYFERDMTTQAIVWSDDMQQLFGFTPAAFGGSYAGYLAMLHPDDRPGIERALAQAEQSGEFYDEEYRVRRLDGDGDYIWIWARGRMLYHAEGKAERMLGICVDITARKAAERELQLSDQRKSNFLAVLGHELRNPLAPMASGIELLHSGGPAANSGPTSVTGIARMLDRQMRHLLRLVDDLLDVSRITHDKIELLRAMTSLQAIVDHAGESCAPLFKAKRQTLRVMMPSDPVSLDVDATRLIQVLANLLNNAAKYSGDGTEIWLTVILTPPGLRLLVRDQGVGIPLYLQAQLFVPFAQSERTLAQSGGGLGIGLALARRLTELHGGTLTVTSAGLGKGSEFCVDLPAVNVQITPAAGGRCGEKSLFLAAAGPYRRRVLVVDDNHDAAESLALLLQHWNLDVEVAYDGSGALQAVGRQRPDVVFLDIGLPDMTGYTLARRLRTDAALKDTLKNTLVVALTGFNQAEDSLLSRLSGCDLHLVKPIDPSYVLKLMQGLAALPA